MELRLLTAADVDAYWTLRLEALEHDPEAFSDSAEEHRTLPRDEIARRLGASSTGNFVVGAFAEDALVGTAGLYRERHRKQRHTGHVWGVYLTPAMRGRGVGRKLLEAVLQRAARIEGIEQIVITVSTSQLAAAALYRSLGFETFGLQPRSLKIDGRYFDEEYMMLRFVKIVPKREWRMDYDKDKVDEMVLALLCLTVSQEDEWGARAWKSHDWDAMDRLHAKGYISDPKSKAKSVVLSPEGLRLARELFERHFARSPKTR